MVERLSALWRRGTNFMDFILKGGCNILTNGQNKGVFVQRRQVCAEFCTRDFRSLHKVYERPKSEKACGEPMDWGKQAQEPDIIAKFHFQIPTLQKFSAHEIWSLF